MSLKDWLFLKNMFWTPSSPMERVWYSPELNQLKIQTFADDNFIFTDEHGLHQVRVHTDGNLYEFYLIGYL